MTEPPPHITEFEKWAFGAPITPFANLREQLMEEIRSTALNEEEEPKVLKSYFSELLEIREQLIQEQKQEEQEAHDKEEAETKAELEALKEQLEAELRPVQGGEFDEVTGTLRAQLGESNERIRQLEEGLSKLVEVVSGSMLIPRHPFEPEVKEDKDKAVFVEGLKKIGVHYGLLTEEQELDVITVPDIVREARHKFSSGSTETSALKCKVSDMDEMVEELEKENARMRRELMQYAEIAKRIRLEQFQKEQT